MNDDDSNRPHHSIIDQRPGRFLLTGMRVLAISMESENHSPPVMTHFSLAAGVLIETQAADSGTFCVSGNGGPEVAALRHLVERRR
jgi:hypothetical protein